MRDILFVDDLVDALMLAQANMNKLADDVFNIGGGSANTTSLLELMALIGEIHGKAPDVRFSDWRPADQLYYVSDTRRFAAATGWSPQTGVRTGVSALYNWLQEFHTVRRAAVLRLGGIRRNGELTGIPSRAVRPKQLIRNRTPKLKVFRGSNRTAKSSERKLAKAA